MAELKICNRCVYCHHLSYEVYRVRFVSDLTDEKHVELMRKIGRNPYDRLAVACYHLFRSQFDNPIVASAEQALSVLCLPRGGSLTLEAQTTQKRFPTSLLAFMVNNQQ